MNEQHRDCESYEPMLAAMLDGELNSSEHEQLMRHVDHCTNCQQEIRDFEKIDLAIEALAHRKDLAESEPAIMPEFHHEFHSFDGKSRSKPKLTSEKHRNTSGWRLVPFAAAATLLICLGIHCPA